MRIPQKLSFAFILAVTLTIDASASCPEALPGPPCQEFWRADAVFIGVATRIVRVPNTTELEIGPYSSTTVYFSVEEIFRGVKGSAMVLEMDYCGYSFNEGERYLVYARRNADGRNFNVRARRTRTRLLSEAKEDLEYIRSTSSAEPGSRIFGTVAQRTLDLKKNESETELLQNIKVTLEGNDQRLEAETDKEGRYEFKGLPPGTYRIRANVPTILNSELQTIEVTGRGCVALNIPARYKGEIKGRVLDVDGRPLFNVPISLISAKKNLEEMLRENKDQSAGPFNLTNRSGGFVFPLLAPGRYLLLINRSELARSRGSETTRALPRLFYPGVSEAAGATVIVVRADDEKPREYEFRLPIRQ
jgi:Carboxypeptidase regulatory-like domain